MQKRAWLNELKNSKTTLGWTVIKNNDGLVIQVLWRVYSLRYKSMCYLCGHLATGEWGVLEFSLIKNGL